MARTVIPTNFQDDELAEEMQGRRRYRQILNLDGTVSFEDETDYDTEGSTFGASRVNEMAQNINESADVNKIIDELEDIAVVTQDGFIAGAKAVKELNSNLTANSNPFKFGYEDGQYGYYLPDGEGGADTLHPFKGTPKLLANGYGSNSSNTFTNQTVDSEYFTSISNGIKAIKNCTVLVMCNAGGGSKMNEGNTEHTVIIYKNGTEIGTAYAFAWYTFTPFISVVDLEVNDTLTFEISTNRQPYIAQDYYYICG